MSRLGPLAVLAALLAMPVAAGEAADLIGREVTFSVRTWDDPERPIFAGATHGAVVGEGPEFGLMPEGQQNGVDVVPVLIDVSARRLVFGYGGVEPGLFLVAEFNGYEMGFAGVCVMVEGAGVDKEATSFPFENDRLSVDRGVLLINMSGLYHDEESQLVIDVRVRDCPVG